MYQIIDSFTLVLPYKTSCQQCTSIITSHSLCSASVPIFGTTPTKRQDSKSSKKKYSERCKKLKPHIMNKILMIVIFSFFFFGCNMNPNKEARIQKLETELQQSIDKIEGLEHRVQTLEAKNEGLKTRLLLLENR